MFTVFTVTWFTSGQTFVGITEDSITIVKDWVERQSRTERAPKCGGLTWVINAMRVHDPCEFQWGIVGTFERHRDAQAKVDELNRTIQFRF